MLPAACFRMIGMTACMVTRGALRLSSRMARKMPRFVRRPRMPAVSRFSNKAYRGEIGKVPHLEMEDPHLAAAAMVRQIDRVDPQSVVGRDGLEGGQVLFGAAAEPVQCHRRSTNCRSDNGDMHGSSAADGNSDALHEPLPGVVAGWRALSAVAGSCWPWM